MQFNTKELLEICRLTAPAMQDNSILPALQYICFRNGKAMATNLQLTILVDAPEFNGLLPHKLLYAVLQTVTSETVQIELQNNEWLLTDGIAKHKLRQAEPIENFPLEPEFNADNTIELTDDHLFHLQNAAKFEGAKTSGAEGCYIGKDIVGTNGTFIYKAHLGAGCALHVPSLFIKALGNVVGNLQYTDRFVCVQAGNCSYISTQLEAKYPGYHIAFEQFPIEWNVRINREVLQNEIKKIMAYAPIMPVASFVFSGNECSINYSNPDFNEEYANTVSCVCSDANVRLNILQLQTILSCFTEPEIEIAIAAPNKSVHIRELNNENTITLIQPVK